MLDGGVEDHCYFEGPFSSNVTITNSTIAVHPSGYFESVPWNGETLSQSKGAIQVGAGYPMAGPNGTLDHDKALLYTGNASLYGSLTIESNSIWMTGAPHVYQGQQLSFPTAAVHVGNAARLALRQNAVHYAAATARREFDFCAYNCSGIAAQENACQGGGCKLSRNYCGV